MSIEAVDIMPLSSNDTEFVTDDNFSYYDDYEDMYNFYRVPQMALVSLLCVSIILGNSCVLAAIRLSETGRKSRMNFFIMHLAIADLLVGVMVSLTDLAQKITIDWYAGNVLCKVIYFTQAVVTYSSTYMLVSLSLDRYDAVARPMSFSRSAQKGRLLVGVGWAVSILFALPTPFIYQQQEIKGRHQCWLDFPEYWHWNLYFTTVAVVTFFIPAVIIAGCYIAIIYIIWSKGRTQTTRCTSFFSCSKSSSVTSLGNVNRTRTIPRSRSTWSQSSPGMVISNSRHETGRGIIPQAKIRTIKMTLIIVIVFILCWSPFFVYNLLELYQLIPLNNPVTTLIQSVAPLNSAANPIIYGIFSTRICRNLRRIPCLRRCACPCTESQSQYVNSFHTHHTYHQHNIYHSYNTNHNIGNGAFTNRNHTPSRHMTSTLATENTAMTIDLQKARSTISRSGSLSVSTYLSGQGHLIQAIPMAPVGNSKNKVNSDAASFEKKKENQKFNMSLKTSSQSDSKLSDITSSEGEGLLSNGGPNSTNEKSEQHTDVKRVDTFETSTVQGNGLLKIAKNGTSTKGDDVNMNTEKVLQLEGSHDLIQLA